jgi:CheY-like chemotaxis protein
VIEAADGQSGLYLYTTCRPALVLLDLLMPGLNGFEFLDQLGSDAPVPVIVVTAKDLTSSDVSRLQGRVRAVLQKAGLRREELVAEVRRQLSAAPATSDS